MLISNSSSFGAGNLVDGIDADLIYNPMTGNVQLDASDTRAKELVSFILATDQNNLRPENFVESSPQNLGPWLNVGTNTDATTFQIGQTDPLGGAVPWVSGDLGDIFPPGMDQGELAEYLTTADYASELGVIGQFDLIVVPEPSTFVFMLGGLLFAARKYSSNQTQRRDG